MRSRSAAGSLIKNGLMPGEFSLIEEEIKNSFREKGDRLLFNLGLPIGLIAGSNPSVLTNRFYHIFTPTVIYKRCSITSSKTSFNSGMSDWLISPDGRCL